MTRRIRPRASRAVNRSKSLSPPTRTLRDRANLDQLRRQAKELLKAIRAGDRAAMKELHAHYRDADPKAIALSDAQLVIARAHGFASWPALTRRVKGAAAQIATSDASRPSRFMTQPDFMRNRQLRRDGVAVDDDQAWAMFCACADGDAKTVRSLIESDPNLNYAQIWYNKPIDLAMRHNAVDAARILLEADTSRRLTRGIYVSRHMISRREVLHRGYLELDAIVSAYKHRLAPRFSPNFERLRQAIETKQLENVAAVLSDRADLLHTSDLEGYCPLHWAVLKRQTEIVEHLLDRGAEIDAPSACGATPIVLSLDHWCHDPGITGYLLARGAACTLSVAASMGHRGKAEAILRADPGAVRRLDANEFSPLMYASREGHAAMVKLLLDHGADVNMPERDADQGGALYWASNKDRRDVIPLLVERAQTCNVEYDSMGCALGCLSNGGGAQRRLAQLMRDHGAYDPGYSLSVDEMKAALREGRAVVQSNAAWGDFTHAVFARGNVELLDLYVDVVGPDRLRTRAYRDAHVKDPAFIAKLIAVGVDPNRRDWLGRTVLHCCAEEGDVTAAAEYLKHGADINAIDVRESATPLGFAARRGKIEMIRFLLDRGADPRLPHDRVWAQPLTFARLEQHAEAIELLAPYGLPESTR